MVPDALATYTDEEHAATLRNFYSVFGDVQTVDEAIARSSAGSTRRRRDRSRSKAVARSSLPEQARRRADQTQQRLKRDHPRRPTPASPTISAASPRTLGRAGTRRFPIAGCGTIDPERTLQVLERNPERVVLRIVFQREGPNRMTIDKTGKWWVGTEPAGRHRIPRSLPSRGIYESMKRAFADVLVGQSRFFGSRSG